MPPAATCGPICATGPTGPPSSQGGGEPTVVVSVVTSQNVFTDFSAPSVVQLNTVITGNAGGWFDTTTYKFTTPAAGLYLVTFYLTFSSFANNGTFQAILIKNGTTPLLCGEGSANVVGVNSNMSFNSLVNLAKFDTLSVYIVTITPGAGAITVYGNGPPSYSTVLTIVSLE